jgi:hypothetical protein
LRQSQVQLKDEPILSSLQPYGQLGVDTNQTNLNRSRNDRDRTPNQLIEEPMPWLQQLLLLIDRCLISDNRNFLAPN